MRASPIAARLVLGAVTFSATLSLGCKGSTDAGDGGTQTSGFLIRFRANGSQTEYRGQGGVFASFGQLGSQSSFNIAAVSDAGSVSGGSINVGIIDAAPITTATYTGFQTVGPSGGFRFAQILYNIGGFEYSNTGAGSDNTITITEMTPTTVRGTFSGTVRAQNRPSISITNGEFFAKRIN